MQSVFNSCNPRRCVSWKSKLKKDMQAQKELPGSHDEEQKDTEPHILIFSAQLYCSSGHLWAGRFLFAFLCPNSPLQVGYSLQFPLSRQVIFPPPVWHSWQLNCTWSWNLYFGAPPDIRAPLTSSGAGQAETTQNNSESYSCISVTQVRNRKFCCWSGEQWLRKLTKSHI